MVFTTALVTTLGWAGRTQSVIPDTRPPLPERPPVPVVEQVPVNKPTPVPPPQPVQVPTPQQVAPPPQVTPPLPPPMPPTSYPSPGGSTPTVDMYLLAALRAQDAKIEELEKRVAALEKRGKE